MNQRYWTDEEDNYIKINFGLITFSDMAKHLGCAINTVQKRAISLGLNVEMKKVSRWTKEEEKLLQEYAKKYVAKTIAKKLGKSYESVKKKAIKLGIELHFERDLWKKWMIDYLKDNINKKPIGEIQTMLGLSYHRIITKCDELGIEYVKDLWTEEEIAILREYAPKCHYTELAKKFPDRTLESIHSKIYKLGIEYNTVNRKWTEEELNYIRNNWGKIPVTDMARNLKVSRIMVQRQADLMNLPKLGNNPYRKWTNDEVEKLRKLAKKKTITELARYFKTTNIAIQTVASRNCIELIDEKIRWTETKNSLLKEYAKTMNLEELAIKMGESTSAIRQQAKRLGITIQKNKKHQDSIWTDENSQQLKDLISQGKTLLQIVTIMNKKDQTLLKKAREMGLQIPQDELCPWTDEDIKNLVELSKTKKLSDLVKELRRPSASIKQQAQRLGITIMADRKNWTPEEYQKLEQLVMVEKKTPKEIAEILGRTEDSITIKINRRGLKNLASDKRVWTKEEETILSDLWGSEPIEKIAKKLNRTVSSVRNKSFILGLGSQIESNFEGLKIKDICDLFNVSPNVVTIYWVALGLKVKTRNITQSTSYQYVEIKDLYEFLERNQNIWDSRFLEKNILGIEPEWLKEKRKSDKSMPLGYFGLDYLTKQQLYLQYKQIIYEQSMQSVEGVVSEELDVKFSDGEPEGPCRKRRR